MRTQSIEMEEVSNSRSIVEKIASNWIKDNLR
jgi:hypothetical protein